MKRDKTTKKVYVGECANSHLVSRPRKRWIDTMECLKKRGLDVRQTRRIVLNKNEYLEFIRRNA